MPLISEEYRSLLVQMHRKHAHFGRGSKRRKAYVESLGFTDVLDYGCGKGRLGLGNKYDPAIPEFSADPSPADLLVCTDVLEHIEPEFLDDVLRHMKSKMRKAGYFSIGCGPAAKKLPNGKNAHLIIKKPEWWVEKLSEYFIVESWSSHPDIMKRQEALELEVHLKPKEPLCEPSLLESPDKTVITSQDT